MEILRARNNQKNRGGQMNERKKRRFHAINSNSSKPHLGGHFNTTHVDKGALKWMKDKLQAKRLVDIGCGPGDQVLTARNLGYDAIGIDGDEELLKNEWSSIDDILIHDYTKGTPEIKGKYDVGWCVEFLEHVEEKYQKNYMKTFQQCKYIICTAAEPGEPGWHHVNCQSKKYWDNIFNEYGYAKQL